MNKLLLSICVMCVAAAAPLLQAQEPSDPNNTIVRFDIRSGGTDFGSIDLELFDSAKPVTVRNFLDYVYSGVYSNVVVNRLLPNYVLQAGTARIPSPDSPAAFTSYTPGGNFGHITNEFEVGPRLSNAFGTIALARVPGETNSGSSTWFINLTNNVQLDEQDGGFTVFGRVVNTTGPNTGTNLLNYFNTRQRDRGIVFAVLTQPFDFITDLPVNYESGRTPPLYRELFVVSARVLQSASGDRARPKVTLAAPTPKLRVVTNGTVRAEGTATEETELAGVFLTRGLQVQKAEGGANWSADLELNPGTNVISVRSIDRAGNVSSAITRNIFYSVPTPITLNTFGFGSILGVTNQQKLEIGRNYVISAKPARGNLFLTWTPDFISSRKILFPMYEGATLTAIFSTNFFSLNRGAYQGTITPNGTNGAPRASGGITLNLTSIGRYTGRLQLLGATFPFRGVFATDQTSFITGSRDGIPLGLSLRLMTNGSQQIVGAYYDGAFVSDVVLYRVQKPADATYAGDYNFIIDYGSNTVSGIGDGTGSGTVEVAENGRISMHGALADGTPIKQSASLLSGGHWAFAAKAYQGRGGAAGMMTLSPTGFAGPLYWFNPSFPGLTGEVRQVTGTR